MSDDAADAVNRPGWEALRTLTAARVALGRAGAGLPTDAHLAFQLTHARARDAVYSALDVAGLREALRPLSANGKTEPLVARSAAPDRAAYLQRPDWGRRLSDESRALLVHEARTDADDAWSVVFAVADGLSATAVNRHAPGVLAALLPLLRGAGDWRIAPLVLVQQGRVAIGDDVATALNARTVVVLIGERPGLSAPDSLGIYLTHRPGPDTTDANRNCVSNVRPEGMPPEAAAAKVFYLLTEARRRGLSGVGLKDDFEGQVSASVCSPAMIPPVAVPPAYIAPA